MDRTQTWFLASVACAGLIILTILYNAAWATAASPAADNPDRSGVRYFIADLKTSFPEHERYSEATALTESNFQAVLNGLKSEVGVNGVRLPIIPIYSRARDYPPLYTRIYAYARGIGLLIYASPMSVGMESYTGWTSARYAAWLADYANTFRPDFLSAFNEAGINNDRMIEIVRALRPRLRVKTLLLGPDRQHVDASIRALANASDIARYFDIVTSHNADRDRSATAENWSRLVQSTDKPVWSSENPADWTRGQSPDLPGIDQAVAGGVQGVVVWMAKPSLVDDNGTPTRKAKEIAAHLGTTVDH